MQVTTVTEFMGEIAISYLEDSISKAPLPILQLWNSFLFLFGNVLWALGWVDKDVPSMIEHMFIYS